MSTKAIGYSVLGRLSSEPMLLSPRFTSMGATISELIRCENADQMAQDYLKDMVAFGAGSIRMPDRIYAVHGGIAVIPIHGVLLNRFNYAFGFATGYNYISAAIQQAVEDDEVSGIILDIDSFGGEAQGCFECADVIYAARAEKPVRAVVDANAYSAGYALASAAQQVVVTPSGGAGSIGVITMHVDWSKALSDMGIKVTFVYAGDHKKDGNPFEPLPESVQSDIQNRIDQAYSRFVSLVSRNRSLDAGAVRATEAQIYTAFDAQKLGLVDAVMPPAKAFTAFLSELTGSKPTEDSAMSTNSQQPGAESQTPAITKDNPEQPGTGQQAAEQAAAEQAAAEQPGSGQPAAEQPNAGDAPKTSAKTERERISAIMGCDEAKERPALAKHLALKTDMSVDEAKGILSQSAKETKPGASGFEAAMSQDNPEVGAEEVDTAGSDKDGLSKASCIILADYQKATGVKTAGRK